MKTETKDLAYFQQQVLGENEFSEPVALTKEQQKQAIEAYAQHRYEEGKREGYSEGYNEGWKDKMDNTNSLILQERIKIWNEAIRLAADNANVDDYDPYEDYNDYPTVDKESILAGLKSEE